MSIDHQQHSLNNQSEAIERNAVAQLLECQDVLGCREEGVSNHNRPGLRQLLKGVFFCHVFRHVTHLGLVLQQRQISLILIIMSDGI